MKEKAKPLKQNGSREPIRLQDQVDEEFEKLLNLGYKEGVEKIEDDVFNQPIVMTVKKDKLVRIAFDARALNESKSKNKYQMPSLKV